MTSAKEARSFKKRDSSRISNVEAGGGGGVEILFFHTSISEKKTGWRNPFQYSASNKVLMHCNYDKTTFEINSPILKIVIEY